MAMVLRLTVAQVAEAVGRHPQTVRKALEAADLHGTQSHAGAHWRVREDCAEAWADGVPCEHQASNVTRLRAKRPA
jgi:predicted transcriptional regulator